jgi:hypothetical protein
MEFLVPQPMRKKDNILFLKSFLKDLDGLDDSVI